MLRNVDFKHYGFLDNGKTGSKTSVPRSVNIPDICPQCGFSITPAILPSCVVEDEDGMLLYVASLYCQHCHKPFIAHFESLSPEPVLVAPKATPSRAFDPRLVELSAGFVRVYNQAFAAEALGMDDISGMGYRKALEYLVKDYLIHRDPDSEEQIKREALGSCIQNRVENVRLKSTARSAVWLGNDFTHYERKYGEYEIPHLKSFIDATVLWILMELTTDEAEMLDRR